MQRESIEEMIARFDVEREQEYGGLIRKYKKPIVNRMGAKTVSDISLTGIRDTDLYLLNSLDDAELINVCLSNHELMHLCSQDEVIGDRLLGLGVDINRHITPLTVGIKIFGASQGSKYKNQRILDFKTRIYEDDFLGRKFFRQTGNKLSPAKIRITEICNIDEDIGLCFIHNNKKYIITDEDIKYTPNGTQGFSFFNAYYVA